MVQVLSRTDRLFSRTQDKVVVAVTLAIGCVLGYLVALATIDGANPVDAQRSFSTILLSPANMDAGGTGSSVTATATAIDVINKEPGWNNLHVYYGDASKKEHFEILTPMSQAKQDVYVAALLKNKKGGFFVDLAAHDATYLSNTFTLERDYQWNGRTYGAFYPLYYYILLQTAQTQPIAQH
jgi:hypothetical protein